MMSPRQRRNIILVSCIVLLLIFLLLLWFLLPKGQKKAAPQTSVQETTIPKPKATVPSPYTTEQLQKEQETRTESAGVISISKLFVQRYGSYSNEANYQNIRDVEPLMSQAFAAATEQSLATKTPPTGFYGVTTRVITAQVVSQDDTAGAAVVVLSTQRVEEKGSAQNTSTKYQDIKLTFVKELGVWKVDSAVWQ